VGKATQAQKNQAQTLRDVREELQQLKFDAEDAALAEEQAAISLEKAREGLARTADLPTDSRARREAELAYKQAELNYRRAKDKSADLNEELRTGAKARAKAAADDPYANLTATQTAFAKFLVKLQPIFKNLKEAVAQGFLPALQDGLTQLITSGNFDDILNGITDIGKALGRATTVLSEFFSSAEAGKYLREIFQTISEVVKEFGPILSKFFKAFLKIMAASSPIVMRLAKFISKMLDDFNGLLDATGDSGLRSFFITAADSAGKFGKIFGNLFGGFAKIVMANFGPGTGGDYLLNWLIEATEGFGTMGKSGDGLKAFFNAVAVNAKSMLSGITSIIKQLVMFGADPNVGFFFEKIKEAAPSVSSILKKAGQALPTVAELIVKVVDIIDKLTDNAAIDNFFKTLVTGADMFQNILGNPVMEKILGFTGQIHAVTLGIKELGDKVGPVFQFIQQSFTNVTDALGAVGDYTKMAKNAFEVVGVANAGMGDSIKKSMKSWRDAALDAEGFSAGTKRAFDYTGLMDKNGEMGKYYFKNASERTRKLIASENGLARAFGRTRLGIEGMHTRFKFFQIGATKGFSEMAESQNKVIKTMGNMGKFMVGHPILMLVLAIVGAFVALYMSNEKFRKQIDAVFKPALDALGEAFRVIMVALQPVILAFQNLMNTLFGGSNGGGGPLTKFFVLLADVVSKLVVALAPLIAAIISALMPIVEGLLNLLIKVVEIMMPIFDSIMAVLMPLIDVFLKLIQLIAGFFEALFTGDWDKFGNLFKDLGHGIVQSLADLFVGFINLIVDLLNSLFKLVMLSPFIGFLADTVKALSGGTIDIRGAVDAGLIPKVPPLVVPKFADGGVVSPSAGGTLGVIAEAGRPERIEPLDPDGLSKRDKAMISMMGGGGAGGINVTVNGTPNMDVNALAAEVSRKLAFQMRKGAAY
jgi:phage-related protein